MAVAQTQTRPQQTYLAQQGMSRGGPSGPAEVLDVLLDKGLVIDVFVRVSVVGIELLTIDTRVVIASVDTYLRFAEAVNRLDLVSANNSQNLGDLVGGGGSRALKSRDSSSGKSSGDAGNAKPQEDDDKSKRKPDSEPEDEPESKSDAESDDEPESNDEPESTSGDDPAAESEDEGASAEAPSGDEDDEGDDKGLLSRIKERGQVF